MGDLRNRTDTFPHTRCCRHNVAILAIQRKHITSHTRGMTQTDAMQRYADAVAAALGHEMNLEAALSPEGELNGSARRAWSATCPAGHLGAVPALGMPSSRTCACAAR